jgi:cobalamin biosynthesis Mg chelatase CobN
MSKKRRSASRSSSASSASSSQQTSSTSQASSTQAKSSTTQAKSSSSKSQQQPKKRSIAYIIAVVYVILHGFFWTAASVATHRAEVDKYPVLFGLLIASALVSVAAGLGMWFWKKWAGYLYLVMGLFVTMLSGDLWLALGSFLPVIVVLYVVYPKLME